MEIMPPQDQRVPYTLCAYSIRTLCQNSETVKRKQSLHLCIIPLWPQESLRNCQTAFSSNCQMPFEMPGDMSYLMAYPDWTFAFLIQVICIKCVRQQHEWNTCASPVTILFLFFSLPQEGRQACLAVLTDCNWLCWLQFPQYCMCHLYWH